MVQNHLPHDHGQTIEQELEHMPSVENFQTVADIFKQLGDGSRIRIFWLLCHCEECVINLSAMVDMSSPAVFHHMIEWLVKIACPSQVETQKGTP